MQYNLIQAVENDEYAIKSYNAIFKTQIKKTDIKEVKELEQCDLLTYGFPCFVGNTIITTKEKLKKIKEVQVGDMCLTHQNRYKRVTKMFYVGLKDIYKIKAMCIDELKTTSNQRFYVRTDTGYSAPNWVETSKLTPNHLLGIAINQNSMLPAQNEFRQHRYWWLLGKYIATGNIKSNHKKSEIVIYGSKPEISTIDEKLTGYMQYTKSKAGNAMEYHISDQETVKNFKKYGKRELNKTITGEIIDLPVKHLAQFINGFLGIDKIDEKHNYKAVSINKELIYALAQCIAKVYHIPYTIERKTIKGKDEISVYTLQFKIKTKFAELYENGYIWIPITKVYPTNTQEPVYDIEIEQDHSFCANGVIAHNCQDISIAGQQAGIQEGTRSGLLLEVERLLKTSAHKPKFLLLENVRNLLSNNHKHDFYNFLNTLEGLGYTNYYKLLNSKHYNIPQNRERVFCLSIRNDINNSFEFPRKIPLEKTLENLLEPEVDKKYYLSKTKITAMLNSSRHSTRDRINTNGIINTLRARDYTEPQCVQIGTLDIKGKDNIKRVYSPKGISPALTTCEGGNRQVKILQLPRGNNNGGEIETDVMPTITKSSSQNNTFVIGAIRGRYTANDKTQQQLELSSLEVTNTLTTVEKDNVVVIIDDTQGFDGVRTYEGISPALRANRQGLIAIPEARKLTPLEYWRLQGYDDSDFKKAKQVCSNSRLYSQAGNGITVNVVTAIYNMLKKQYPSDFKDGIKLISLFSGIGAFEKAFEKIPSDTNTKSVFFYKKVQIGCVNWIDISSDWEHDGWQDISYRTGYNFIDMFSGAGGFSCGLAMAGFTPIASNELQNEAVATYRYNFITQKGFDEHIELGDIRIQETKSRIYNSVYGKPIDLIIGGFPCQGFSLAGRRIVTDERNSLYREMLEVVKTLKSKFVVMENVDGLRTMLNGEVERQIINDYKDIGYNIQVATLNSANYYVPQIRNRVIFIGNRIGLKNYHPTPLLNSAQYITLGECIAPYMYMPENKAINHIYTKHSKTMQKKLSDVQEGKSLYGNYSDSWKKSPWDKPSCTVKENHGGVNIHPKLPRVLTPRELAALQSFPDDFIFKGTKKWQLVQIGNAVPPLLGKAIGIAVLKTLRNG